MGRQKGIAKEISSCVSNDFMDIVRQGNPAGKEGGLPFRGDRLAKRIEKINAPVIVVTDLYYRFEMGVGKVRRGHTRESDSEGFFQQDFCGFRDLSSGHRF